MMLTIDRNGSISVTTGEGIEGLGNIKINVKGNTEINTTGDTKITSTTGKVIIDSDANMVELGRNVAKQLVNNFPNCVICGVPHNVDNTNVWA